MSVLSAEAHQKLRDSVSLTRKILAFVSTYAIQIQGMSNEGRSQMVDGIRNLMDATRNLPYERRQEEFLSYAERHLHETQVPTEKYTAQALANSIEGIFNTL
jgi:hypothetical protein